MPKYQIEPGVTVRAGKKDHRGTVELTEAQAAPIMHYLTPVEPPIKPPKDKEKDHK